MRKKYFTLTFTFLCLLIGQSSFGQISGGDKLTADETRDILDQVDADNSDDDPNNDWAITTVIEQELIGTMVIDNETGEATPYVETTFYRKKLNSNTSSESSSSGSSSSGSFTSWGGSYSSQPTYYPDYEYDESSTYTASSDNSMYSGSSNYGTSSTYLSLNISYTTYYYDSYGNIAVANFSGVNPFITNTSVPADCNITLEDLKKIFPGVSNQKLQTLVDVINKYAQKFGIDTKEKLHFFLSQVKKETGNLNSYVENSQYYRHKSIMKGDFAKYFNPIGQENANPNKKNISDIMIQGSPFVDGKKYFNIVYDDRNPNRNQFHRLGNTQNGDGYNFRGGGALHLTGRENYTNFNTFYNQIQGITPHDFTINPELIHNNTDNLGIIAGMWFFKTKVLDKDKRFQIKAESTDLNKLKILSKGVSNIVQGGTKTADERFKNYNLAKESIIKCN